MRDQLTDGEMRFWKVFHFTFFWVASLVGFAVAYYTTNDTIRNVAIFLSIPILTFCYGLMIEGAWLSWWLKRH